MTVIYTLWFAIYWNFISWPDTGQMIVVVRCALYNIARHNVFRAYSIVPLYMLSSHTVYGTYTFIYIEPGVSVQRWKSHLACQKLVKYWPFPIGPTAARRRRGLVFVLAPNRACIFIALFIVFVCVCVSVPKNLTSIIRLYSWMYIVIYVYLLY